MLFQLGDFIMHSGGVGHWKIDCDALTDADIACLAFMLSERLPAFCCVVGVPRGGLRLAKALSKYARTQAGDDTVTVVADDVLSTGRSMEEERAKHYGRVVGAVLFARAPIIPEWITPLFTISPPR